MWDFRLNPSAKCGYGNMSIGFGDHMPLCLYWAFIKCCDVFIYKSLTPVSQLNAELSSCSIIHSPKSFNLMHKTLVSGGVQCFLQCAVALRRLPFVSEVDFAIGNPSRHIKILQSVVVDFWKSIGVPWYTHTLYETSPFPINGRMVDFGHVTPV